MAKPQFDDETLMAFADGELDDAAAAAVENALAHDDALMARVALFLETRARAKAELMSAEPVPSALEAAVREMVASFRKPPAADAPAPTGNVLSIDAMRRERPVRGTTWQLPLAASLAAAIAAGVIGYQLGSASRPSALQFADVSQAAVDDALSKLLSGEEQSLPGDDGRIRIVASFRADGGVLCREYEVDPTSGASLVAVSCREVDAWTMRFAVTAPAGPDGYAPASSMDALEAYLSAIDAGPPLGEGEEASALAEIR